MISQKRLEKKVANVLYSRSYRMEETVGVNTYQRFEYNPLKRFQIMESQRGKTKSYHQKMKYKELRTREVQLQDKNPSEKEKGIFPKNRADKTTNKSRNQ